MAHPESPAEDPGITAEQWRLERWKGAATILGHIIGYEQRRNTTAWAQAWSLGGSPLGLDANLLNPTVADRERAEVDVAMAKNAGIDMRIDDRRLATLCTWHGPDRTQRDPNKHTFGYNEGPYMPNPPSSLKAQVDISVFIQTLHKLLQEGPTLEDTTPNAVSIAIGKSVVTGEQLTLGLIRPILLPVHGLEISLPLREDPSIFAEGPFLAGRPATGIA